MIDEGVLAEAAAAVAADSSLWLRGMAREELRELREPAATLARAGVAGLGEPVPGEPLFEERATVWRLWRRAHARITLGLDPGPGCLFGNPGCRCVAVALDALRDDDLEELQRSADVLEALRPRAKRLHRRPARRRRRVERPAVVAADVVDSANGVPAADEPLELAVLADDEPAPAPVVLAGPLEHPFLDRNYWF